MALHSIKKGLDLPITGQPEQRIEEAPQPKAVAIMADDYIGMRPRMNVAVGDDVKRGQMLFEDKKMPGVRFTALAAGKVVAINRGERRALQSVVVQISDAERSGDEAGIEHETFDAYTGNDPAGLTSEQVRALLVESGLWTALRARPFGKVADPSAQPHSIFINAMDSNPLAPSADEVIKGNEDTFNKGLLCVAKISEGKTYFCKERGSAITSPDPMGILIEEFEGPHPAGTSGVHINAVDPAHREKTVWFLDYQDVIAIGALFSTGKLAVNRVISLAGPQVAKPGLLKTRLGTSTDNLTNGALKEGENRVISGSVFNGRSASGDTLGYLGRYHSQITALLEGREREFMGWMAPGKDKFSVVNAYISRLFPGKKYGFNTSGQGSKRAIVPIGLYEKVMPMDILPTFLLRSLMADDLERAEELGCLELIEEDVALCSFVCPGKNDFGTALRKVLTEIEKEG